MTTGGSQLPTINQPPWPWRKLRQHAKYGNREQQTEGFTKISKFTMHIDTLSTPSRAGESPMHPGLSSERGSDERLGDESGCLLANARKRRFATPAHSQSGGVRQGLQARPEGEEGAQFPHHPPPTPVPRPPQLSRQEYTPPHRTAHRARGYRGQGSPPASPTPLLPHTGAPGGGGGVRPGSSSAYCLEEEGIVKGVGEEGLEEEEEEEEGAAPQRGRQNTPITSTCQSTRIVVYCTAQPHTHTHTHTHSDSSPQPHPQQRHPTHRHFSISIGRRRSSPP
ncbi:hypothetical protein FOCC_FOCC004515 [Frankliniella occidentalis]|nr:hypothetical protein FOCC_FOCC004515 [Frankliniella occidentalis]